MTNLSPEFWGPYFWKAIHLLIIGLPDELTSDHRQAITDYFNSLIYLLPCKSCRYHYSVYFEQYPVDISSKQALWNWSVDLHNNVNNRNKKKKLDYNQAISETFKSPNIGKVNYYKYLFYICLLIIIVYIICCFFK